jgi:tetratricopeptide (TPR) repeat protein
VSVWLQHAWCKTQANAALVLGQRERALELFQRMVELDPADGESQLSIGNLQVQLGDVPAGIETFRRLTAASPGLADGWFNLAFLLEGREQLGEAEAAFRRALAVNDKHDRAWYGLALVLIRNGRLAEAIDALRHNIKLQPFSPYGYYQLGMTQHHLGLADAARETVDKLKSFEPRYAATLKRDIENTPSRALRAPGAAIESQEVEPAEKKETSQQPH